MVGRRPRLLSVLGPGLVLAATGVGAGDLATASFSGSLLGTAVLWAVVTGACMKLVLSEGLTRWQLATGETLLEGVVRRFGRWAGWIFMPYLLLWSLFVGSAMASACGVTLQAALPLFDDPARGKVAFGLIASVGGAVLVWRGGYRLVERLMGGCVVLMCATVVVTAALVWDEVQGVGRGLLVPSIPDQGGQGLGWTVALMGGVGGTLTVLCYGYWIREEGRSGPAHLRLCRVDLAMAYAVTALFGLAMVIVGSTVELDGRGADLLVVLAERLERSLGSTGRVAFLVGALGAVLSSLVGVWQAVPYLFADLWRLVRGQGVAPDARSPVYRAYLIALAAVPAVGLWVPFAQVQKAYAFVGAWFMPLLALVLLVLNGRRAWVGSLRNGWPTVVALLATLGFFGMTAIAFR